MAGRTSLSMLKLNGVVDEQGAALNPDIVLQSTDNPVIAPWIEEPPTPPPKPVVARSFGFAPKSSFSSFVSMRQGSTTSFRQPRHSDSQSTLSIPEDNRRSMDDGDSSRRLLAGSPPDITGLKKAKSSMFARLKGRSSRTRLRADSSETEHPSLRPPAPPLPDQLVSFLPIPPAAAAKKGRKGKLSTGPQPPSPPPKEEETEFRLDTDIDKMDGIIDLTMQFSNGPSSPSSGFGSIQSQSISDHSSFSHVPEFINPFPPTSTPSKRHGMVAPARKVSPTTVLPPINPNHRPPVTPMANGGPGSPTWTPPESWAVEKVGGDAGEGDYSSSEESTAAADAPRRHASVMKPGRDAAMSQLNQHPPAAAGTLSPKPRQPRRGMKRPSVHDKPYIIRIYRANNTFHVASIGFQVSVGSLTPALNEKLLSGDDRETHRLYLKERGRERMLLQTERPAVIVRRRLEQAGYDPADGLELLGGEGLSFLLKFVYKSQLLGPAEEELAFDNFDLIDLTGRGLRTIPVVLHQNADQIVSLKLSRNPMLEIPLDFIQSCTTLRELRLSNMAMKKVPHSVRHSTTLHRLDLSSNRIVDLDEAYLDNIPGLTTLFVQNNRIEKLPWHFPRLRSLVTLNISNNKFNTLPSVVTELENLRDLDISFNTISELPDLIGRLVALERLVIVGNQVSRLPDECRKLVSLRLLDCRRNQISDLTVVCMLPKLQNLSADHNAVHALDLSLGPCLKTLDASHNEITQLSLRPGPVGKNPYALTSLDISYAKLSSLDDFALGQLSSLRSLRLDHNTFRVIPDTLGDLSWLETLSCSDNKLDALPLTIGKLQKLEVLDAHNNSLSELPITLWNCASLTKINVTSNFLGFWHDPPASSFETSCTDSTGPLSIERKTSATSVGSSRSLPPLAYSLEKLYLGENRLTDDGLHPLMILRELKVLNLSFNEIQDMPPTFFKNLTHLEELYLSGNKLTNIPTEDLPKLTKLAVLFLNGNRLQTLPQELGKVKSLMILDVGSNVLKYNINNWEFDWNWNFNKNLKYLNLSGNKKLQIKSDAKQLINRHHSRDLSSLGRQSLSGFTDLTQLRVLGLMDVTITTAGMGASVDIPDENDDRRVRTSLSTVNGMSYGIADALGRNEYLNMLDLVHEFRGHEGKAIFAMFGRAQPPKLLPLGASPNRLAKFLHDKFVDVFIAQLKLLNSQRETVCDALRRTFLKLNQDLHDSLFTSALNNSVADPATLRSGASGIVVYFIGKTMYVANVGDALAVISRGGAAQPVSRKHDPFDRLETARIRAAEGWVSPPGLVNDEIDISRSFGFYHLLPVVNARPDIFTCELSELDEFVIVANRGLWDYVPYQTAVDIARTERSDPMIAAQKLRDFAISYGAEGSTMIMVIGVSDLFDSGASRSRQPTIDPSVDVSLYPSTRRRRDDILDHDIIRVGEEVPAPTGHLALAFTDIRNSTHLWEANPGMPTAMRLHNSLLRRQLRFCGGYEVKTEGDSFMCSFPTALSAVWWCLSVQIALLQESWPLEILECEDGKPIYDAQNQLIARGLSVRMGIHCGSPLCERDPITHRMDYFGPMVNRSARVESGAAGGQIMCSAEIIREINAKILEIEPETEYSRSQPAQAVDAIRRLGIVIVPVGEVKLKGLELPEVLSLIYPKGLEGRQDLKDAPSNPTASGSRVPFSVVQMRELGVLCLRLEALASSRIFRPLPDRKGSIQTISADGDSDERYSPVYLYGDPNVLLPPMNQQSSDSDLMMLLDSLSVRIENALSTLTQKYCPPSFDRDAFIAALNLRGGLDERTLNSILTVLSGL
ncbi:hypothetical protein BD779DRAFT_1506295 [Infundibulicybe gibba]|nr:hypothetical protein BD779DRAFT_1506295 [Infundibulicybe gibba]